MFNEDVETDDVDTGQDICRVCRCEAQADRPLFHPCICTGSIKFIHQECLLQWLKYSKKEYCELCKHRFTFRPIYAPDMPKRLPMCDIMTGLAHSVARALRAWLHYTLVALAWLGVVPLTACRIYRCLFAGNISSLLTLPLDLLSAENLLVDCVTGALVVSFTLVAFIGLVWLREQILMGAGPRWLEEEVVGAVVAADGDAPHWLEEEPPGAAVEVDNAVEEAPRQARRRRLLPNFFGGGAGGAPAVAAEGGGAGAEGEDNAWNPIEWDRAAEDLTWERLLGLDGSLVFLEHVFWVVSLNTLFIIFFAFLPFHIGRVSLTAIDWQSFTEATQFSGALTTIFGYAVVALLLMVLYGVLGLVGVARLRRAIGLAYVAVKVSLLIIMEMGLGPLICGCWLDVCSLAMFDASLSDRLRSFYAAPGTCMFIHWLVGMILVFYFASFVLLLREVVRPGVLWFLRNLNDPDLNPVHEMLQLSVLHHIRRFAASTVLFGSLVLVMLWAPVAVIRRLLPGFLPYTVLLSSDSPVSELSLELLFLQVILPALLEQGQTRAWLKRLVRTWCSALAWLLDLRSFLLGHEDQQQNVAAIVALEAPQPLFDAPAPAPPPAPAPEEGLAGAHQALLQAHLGGPDYVNYHRPPWFLTRICTLIFLLVVTLFLVSVFFLTVPVQVGRLAMRRVLQLERVHELYTAAAGLYMGWLCARAALFLRQWLFRGRVELINRIQDWAVTGFKMLFVGLLFLLVLPLLLSLLFELIVVIPLRVPLDQTPIFNLWQSWVMGILHTKILCAMTMMGPAWWLKDALEQVYHIGFRDLTYGFIGSRLWLPLTTLLGSALAMPYVVAHSLVPVIGVSEHIQQVVQRQIYLVLCSCIFLVALIRFQICQFRRLYNHIRNDKYLVGQRLVNYEHNSI